MKYAQRKDGEWFCVSPSHNLKCCDCGLVHSIKIKKKSGRFWMQAIRNNKATSQVRRFMKDRRD